MVFQFQWRIGTAFIWDILSFQSGKTGEMKEEKGILVLQDYKNGTCIHFQKRHPAIAAARKKGLGEDYHLFCVGWTYLLVYIFSFCDDFCNGFNMQMKSFTGAKRITAYWTQQQQMSIIRYHKSYRENTTSKAKRSICTTKTLIRLV